MSAQPANEVAPPTGPQSATNHPERYRTAVIVVHGMGEQKPRDTVNGFVQTGLIPIAESETAKRTRTYYSRPTLLTDSFEARVLLAIERDNGFPISQTQTDFYEYHWSYLMTGNVISDLVPLIRRLMLRPPWRVPGPLRVAWALMWAVVIGLVTYVCTIAPDDLREDFSLHKLIATLIPNGLLAALAGLVVFGVIAKLTSTFVDVARYLDTSPRSYAVRRSIRGGMVDLLRTIQDSGRYSRVVVVAHSLGAYIAYDGLTSLWTSETERMSMEFETLGALEDAANALPATGSRATPTKTQAKDWREAQNALWREMRDNDLPWLVTDFISVGTPMYIADMLITSKRTQFANLCKRSEMPLCPPISDTENIEDAAPQRLSYGWRRRPRLVTGSPFAVVRWTNLWFPSILGFFGDWFGGPLMPLFGTGISDIKVTGNLPGRLVPALAHTRYFRYPEQMGHDDIATYLHTALALNTRAGWNASVEGSAEYEFGSPPAAT